MRAVTSSGCEIITTWLEFGDELVALHACTSQHPAHSRSVHERAEVVTRQIGTQTLEHP